MSKRNLGMMFVMLGIAVLFCVCPVFAEYGGEKIETALTRTIEWSTKIIGGGLTVIGIIYVGVRMAMHDERALSKGALVVVGGLIIFLSNNILNLIKGIAGY